MPELLIFLQNEAARNLIGAPGEGAVENTIINLVQWLKLAIETTGAIVIGIGVVISVFEFVRALVPPQMESYNRIRLTLARYLALALEFQLGADILSTAVARAGRVVKQHDRVRIRHINSGTVERVFDAGCHTVGNF